MALAMLAITVIAGCTNKPEVQKENQQLKVLTYNEKTFNEKYGNFFLATHPNYELQVISVIEHLKPEEDLNQLVEKLMATEQPDIVSLNMDHYIQLKEQNKLASLTPSMKKDDFDPSGYTPAILNFLTDEQGETHGLTPTFIGSALYYNKKMFKESGISVPADGITWNEVFRLAQQFPYSDLQDPRFGYYDKYAANPFLRALYIGESSGLSFFGHDRFTLSSDSWEEVFRDVTDCYKSKVCYGPEPNRKSETSTFNLETAEIANYPFLSGRIAMAVNDSSLYGKLTISKDRYPDLDWGIVPIPTGAEQAGLGNGIAMNEIFSIPKNADPEAGWDFISYVCGEDYARLLPRINPEELPARQPSVWKDEQLKSFYRLERISNVVIHTLRSLPKPVIEQMDAISQKHMADILSDRKSVSDALKMLEAELQTAFDAVEK